MEVDGDSGCGQDSVLSTQDQRDREPPSSLHRTTSICVCTTKCPPKPFIQPSVSGVRQILRLTAWNYRLVQTVFFRERLIRVSQFPYPKHDRAIWDEQWRGHLALIRWSHQHLFPIESLIYLCFIQILLNTSRNPFVASIQTTVSLRLRGLENKTCCALETRE